MDSSTLDRRLDALSPDERAELEIDLSPREYVIDYLELGLLADGSDHGRKLHGQQHLSEEPLLGGFEARASRRLSPDERAELEIDLSPREYVIDYLERAFPTRQMRVPSSADVIGGKAHRSSMSCERAASASGL
jgi:hypothetical protein